MDCRGSDIRQGDRALIWQGGGEGSQRGVVALAEVTADPEVFPVLDDCIGSSPNGGRQMNVFGCDGCFRQAFPAGTTRPTESWTI